MAFHVGLAVVGVVGGAIVGVGLAVSARRRAAATAALLEHGERVRATVVSVVSQGAQLQWRTVVLRCDDGREVRDQLDSAVAARLALAPGSVLLVVRSRRAEVAECRLVDALDADGHSVRVAVLAGAVIAVLGLAAALAW